MRARGFRFFFFTAPLWGCSRPAPVDELAALAPGDHGALCTDVGQARACWGEGGPAVVPRPLPARAAPAGGWRCGGMREQRRCEPRRRNAGPFVCSGDRCEQAIPRLPDDGEWECYEADGALFCHGGGAPAGVAAGPADIGWLCGVRRSGDHERLCVDLSPDLPDEQGPWACRFEHKEGTRRVCERRKAPSWGAPCAAARECPKGGRCEGGRCLPARVAPECWFDDDCGPSARCRVATCEEKRP